MSFASGSNVSARRSRTLALVAIASGACVPMVQAQSVTDGNSAFTIDTSATFANTSGATVRTGTGGGSTAALTTGGLTTTDHLFQTWWWYRVSSGAREFALSGRTAGVAAGNTITLDYTEPEGFTAQLKYVLTDGPDTTTAPFTGPAANVGYSCEIVNTGASPLTISLFNYSDFDISATAGLDSAALAGPGLIEVTDTTTLAKGQYLGVAPDLAQVTVWAALRTALGDTAVTNLNNSGLPFAAADFTGAYQWNLNIPVGGRATVRGALSINQVAVAPTSGPACIADFNGVGGVTVQDIFDFLIAWFNNAPAADVNGVGGVTVQDVFDFLTAWFNGCP